MTNRGNGDWSGRRWGESVILGWTSSSLGWTAYCAAGSPSSNTPMTRLAFCVSKSAAWTGTSCLRMARRATSASASSICICGTSKFQRCRRRAHRLHGRQMSFCFQHSLRQLARYLASRPDLDDVSLVRCTMEFGGRERDDQMVRLIGRYGFELVPSATMVAMGERALRFGENIHISLMVLARNAAALRRDTLRRGRTRVFMSRKVLEQRYGGGAGSVDLQHRPSCPS